MGKLIPVHIQEALPGDSFRISQEAMFRMMPMVAPVMQKVDYYFHNFFVPNRILWPNWENFITGGPDGDANPAHPTILVGDVAASTLENYMGFPVDEGVDKGTLANALPFAAYQRIWYEWFRDQNLQDVSGISLTDGQQDSSNEAALKTLRERAWEHDYFTSALPFAQKGEAVEIPFNVDELVIAAMQPGTEGALQPVMRNSATGAIMTPGSVQDQVINTNGETHVTTIGAGYVDPNNTLQVQGGAMATINDLRSAFSLQKWLEKMARGGSRYFEVLKNAFDVKSPDARLQRPEYLGGSKGTMAISEVLQTSSTDATTAQGNMAGHGIGVSAGSVSSHNCAEHGWYITVLSMRPKTAYYTGLHRHFWKADRFSYAWPDFAQLGEQPVFKGELVLTGDPEIDGATFGYMPRYSEYRYNPSRVCGQMATTLEFWHLGRKFDMTVEPNLNADFIICDPSKRIFAVEDPDEDEIVGHIFHKIQARRPLPKYGTPGIF